MALSMRRIFSVLAVAALMAAMMVVLAAPSFATRTASCEGLTRSFDGGTGGVSNSAAANENAKVREGGFFGC